MPNDEGPSTPSTEPASTFAAALEQYSANLDSLRDFVDVVHDHLYEREIEMVKEHADDLRPLALVLREFGLGSEGDTPGTGDKETLEELVAELGDKVSVEVEGEGPTRQARLTMPADVGKRFRRGMRAFRKAHERTSLLFNGSLMNLTGHVELLFGDLFRIYYACHPGAVGTRDKVFSFEDLSNFDSVSAAREHFVASRIESLLYSSFSDWLDFFRSNAKLSMGYLDEDVDLLVETFQRRNLVVHNAGIVNSIYLNSVHPKLLSDVTLGQPLPPNRDYLVNRIDLFERDGLLVAAELWKKLFPSHAKRGSVLLDLTYKHLLAARWSVAVALTQFTVQDRQLTEAARCVASLNNWLCRKRLGQWEQVRGEVNAADFSARSLRFQLGLLGLQEAADEWFALLPKTLQADEISLDELNEFPIFDELRRDQRFDQYRKPAQAEPQALGEGAPRTSPKALAEAQSDDTTTS